MSNAPPKLPPPPARKPATPAATGKTFAIGHGRVSGAAQRTVLYGPGGVGKSTLASLAPSPVFLDIEHGTRELDVPRVDGIESFADLRSVLQSDLLDPYRSIILDSATRAEEFAIAHTLGTVPTEKGDHVANIEAYGFGKGYQHVYDTYLLLLADFDRHIRAGRHVILIAHDCTADVPNPMGENFIRYEPHLQSPKSGKASIRNRVVQWADHVLFLGYDVIAKDGKGKGGGTRTIWTVELPSHVAKSRLVAEARPYESPTDATIWSLILNGGQP